MAYVDGYLLAVPTENRVRYRALAEEVWPMFARHGAMAMREWWGDDVPDGEVTSFPMAVKLEPGETVVFAWVEWPDKATRDAGNAGMRAEMAASGDDGAGIPFDVMRMMWGGFAPFVDCRAD
ncbi:MAG: DUF1428 domain-containing protein [Paracoccaceae bacterium]|nr:DUF1428 domain-containing protein [Paracoccaceae bacterium]